MTWEKLCPNLSFTVENKTGNLQKNKAGHISVLTQWMRYSTSLNFKYLSMEMNWKKNQFSITKNELLCLLGILCIPQTLWP